MHHEHRSVFSPGERETLLAVATAAMPPGKRLPGANERCVQRVEGYLEQIGGAALTATRAVLAALDAEAYARRFKKFARLPEEKRRDILEAWRTGGYFRRMALRGTLVPLKMAHFDDPALFRELGCVYGVETPKTIETPRWMTERVTRGADVAADEELECDVVVIGTGAGGAVVAKEL